MRSGREGLALKGGRLRRTSKCNDTMKTSELTGAQLDFWVAKADGKTLFRAPSFDAAGDRWQWISDGGKKLHNMPLGEWQPSTKWAQGGPIIEREQIGLSPRTGTREKWWHAECPVRDGSIVYANGPTPLIAAMRAFVASVYGDEVPDDGQRPEIPLYPGPPPEGSTTLLTIRNGDPKETP